MCAVQYIPALVPSKLADEATRNTRNSVAAKSPPKRVVRSLVLILILILLAMVLVMVLLMAGVDPKGVTAMANEFEFN